MLIAPFKQHYFHVLVVKLWRCVAKNLTNSSGRKCSERRQDVFFWSQKTLTASQFSRACPRAHWSDTLWTKENKDVKQTPASLALCVCEIPDKNWNQRQELRNRQSSKLSERQSVQHSKRAQESGDVDSTQHAEPSRLQNLENCRTSWNCRTLENYRIFKQCRTFKNAELSGGFFNNSLRELQNFQRMQSLPGVQNHEQQEPPICAEPLKSRPFVWGQQHIRKWCLCAIHVRSHSDQENTQTCFSTAFLLQPLHPFSSDSKTQDTQHARRQRTQSLRKVVSSNEWRFASTSFSNFGKDWRPSAFEEHH